MHALLALLAAVTLAQDLDDPSLGVWKLVDTIELEIPKDDRKFRPGPSTLLADGRLVVQRNMVGTLFLFDQRGAVVGRREPPPLDGHWPHGDRFGKILGDRWETLWIAPSVIWGVDGEIGRLWEGKRFYNFSAYPVAEAGERREWVDLTDRVAAVRDGGYWVVDHPCVRALDREFETVGWVRGEDGKPFEFRWAWGLDVGTDGVLAVLESRTPAWGCGAHNAVARREMEPDRVFLVDAAGTVTREIVLPEGHCNDFDRLAYDSGCLILSGRRAETVEVRLDGSCGGPLQLEGLEQVRGLEPFLFDRGTTLRFFDAGLERVLVYEKK